MRLTISISVVIISSITGWLGSLLDNGNWLGGWSIIFTTIGSFLGIWVGYKIYKNYL